MQKQPGRIVVDLTGVRAGFEPLPRGEYPATVFDVEQKLSKRSGSPMLEVTFKVQEPPESAGRQAWTNISLLPQALWVYKGFLTALGFPDDTLDGVVDVGIADLLGQPCRIVIDHEVYEGKPRQRVVEINAANNEGFVPVGGASGGDLFERLDIR